MKPERSFSRRDESGRFQTSMFRICVRCLCIRRDRLLLIKHFSPLTGLDFWALPGGLVEKGETIADAGARELIEETGLVGTPTGVAGIQEFQEARLVEIIIAFSDLRGRAKLGCDPEQPTDTVRRLIELRWFHCYQLPEFQPLSLRKEIISGSGFPKQIGLPDISRCD